jgi:23S rRNA (uracil1939-C5)-methyltransferase
LLLTIEKMIYGGDGLARLPVAHHETDEHASKYLRGKAVFVPFVLPGEEIEAAVAEEKPGYMRAQAQTILHSSSRRIEPQCPYFGACGGCQYQHAKYEHQLEIKKEILGETLRRLAKLELPCEIEIHPSPPWNYRNRSRLQVRVSPEFAAGYFKFGSHELMPVEQCPISSPLINRAISAVLQSGRAGRAAAGVREIEFFANADDTKLLMELYCEAGTRRSAVRSWAEDLRAALPEIAGVTALRTTQAGGRATGTERLLSLGESSLTYETQLAAYRVSAGAFFQTNRYLTDELLRVVTQNHQGEVAFDFYAGVGLFSTVLARDFHHVIAVESSQLSTGDLAYNLSSKGKVIQASTEQYLSRSQNLRRAGTGTIHNLHRPDLAVVDPPRNGLGERVAKLLANLGAPRVVYVSCDPTTLARDSLVLLAAGYRVEQAHLVDLFPQTYHLESVLHFKKEG